MNRIALVVAVLAAGLTVGHGASAEIPVFETSTVAAYGGPLGVALADTKFRPVRLPTGLIAQRFALPRYSGVSLQMELVPQSGLGTSVAINLAHGESWRWNLVGGCFRPLWGSQMSVPDLPRKWDLTGGTSLEALVSGDHWWLTGEYRVFLPDLGLKSQMNSVYGRVALDAVKGGQLWLGVRYSY